MLWQRVQELYNPTEAFESVQLHRINKYVYVEGAKICYTYVYDLLVHTPNNAYALIKDKLIVNLIYSTTTRVWSLNIHQASEYQRVPFEN